MGSCASVHQSSGASATKLHLSFGSKADKLVTPSPIIDGKPLFYPDHSFPSTGLKSLPPPAASDFTNSGSKEENFFESQPWLESDCDDDFFSVNGDFTPSRGSTPVHQKFSTTMPKINRASIDEKYPSLKAEPSPTSKKKKLAEFFKESPQIDLYSTRNTPSQSSPATQNREATLPPRSSSGTPYHSGSESLRNGERTPNNFVPKHERKSMRSAQCCLPGLLSGHSSVDKGRSPACNVVG